MSESRVVAVYDYPVKGAAGRPHRRLHVDPAIGVVNDRRCAFKRRADMPDEWAPKGAFFVGMNTALMVAQVPVFVTDRDGNEQLDPQWLDTVAKRLGVESLNVLDTQGAFSLADRPRRYVSIINLASVRPLGEFVGTAIDPARFRMNVWIDGLEPFAELDWVEGHPARATFRSAACACAWMKHAFAAKRSKRTRTPGNTISICKRRSKI